MLLTTTGKQTGSYCRRDRQSFYRKQKTRKKSGYAIKFRGMLVSTIIDSKYVCQHYRALPRNICIDSPNSNELEKKKEGRRNGCGPPRPLLIINNRAILPGWSLYWPRARTPFATPAGFDEAFCSRIESALRGLSSPRRGRTHVQGASRACMLLIYSYSWQGFEFPAAALYKVRRGKSRGSGTTVTFPCEILVYSI